MKYFLILLFVTLLTSCTTMEEPLCRHIVLSQYAAFKDAGYQTEIWHMKNNNPEKAKGFKYHVAIRIKVEGKWQWVTQPQITFTTSEAQPRGTTLLRKMKLNEVVAWVK